MSDTVKVEMTQFDGDKKISYVSAEWYDMDRDGANVMSMSLAGVVLGKVDEWRQLKAAGVAAKDMGNVKTEVEVPTPKGPIR